MISLKCEHASGDRTEVHSVVLEEGTTMDELSEKQLMRLIDAARARR